MCEWYSAIHQWYNIDQLLRVKSLRNPLLQPCHVKIFIVCHHFVSKSSLYLHSEGQKNFCHMLLQKTWLSSRQRQTTGRNNTASDFHTHNFPFMLQLLLELWNIEEVLPRASQRQITWRRCARKHFSTSACGTPEPGNRSFWRQDQVWLGRMRDSDEAELCEN